ncbi:PQ-loop domain containing protein [Lysobacter dokdonensis DS-58]|uniref:PQ-loop domain containing protein n=1 Tax=Lysobacter dokdonensis DS-58 TaxID=1300345 RepID=A0A0A2WPR3_9GAMM|nr:SemiSWEET transporter [Lysobacter dokdonensis]KGQ20722.1 PQ-loop domain containing protein [Lysobacter dokdonensis DS-58]
MDIDLTWTGYVAATLTTVAFVPQAVKTLRTRDTRSISLHMYLVFTVGVAFWLAYGVALHSWPMIVSNTVTLGLAGTILAMKLRWR